MNLVIIFRATEEEDMLQQVLAIISNLRCLWANVPVPVYMVSGNSTWPCCKLHLQARDAYTSPICINGHTDISDISNRSQNIAHPGDCLIPIPLQTSSAQTPGGMNLTRGFGICE